MLVLDCVSSTAAPATAAPEVSRTRPFKSPETWASRLRELKRNRHKYVSSRRGWAIFAPEALYIRSRGCERCVLQSARSGYPEHLYEFICVETSGQNDFGGNEGFAGWDESIP